MGFRFNVMILAAVLLLGVTGAAFASGRLPVNVGTIADPGSASTSVSGDDSSAGTQNATNEDDNVSAGESAVADEYGSDDATEVDDDDAVETGDDDATEVDDEDEIEESNHDSSVMPPAMPPASGNSAYSRGDDDDDSSYNGTAGSGMGGSHESSMSAPAGSESHSRSSMPEPRERD